MAGGSGHKPPRKPGKPGEEFTGTKVAKIRPVKRHAILSDEKVMGKLWDSLLYQAESNKFSHDRHRKIATLFFQQTLSHSGISEKERSAFATFYRSIFNPMRKPLAIPLTAVKVYPEDYVKTLKFSPKELEPVRKISPQGVEHIGMFIDGVYEFLERQVGGMGGSAVSVMVGLTYAKALWGHALEQAGIRKG